MIRSKFLKNVYKLDQTLRDYDNDHLIHILLYRSEKFNFNLNKEIIKPTICYLKDTERFNESLIWNIYCFCFRFCFVFSICCYYYYHNYFIASQRWFLTYIYSNFENTLFGLSNLELFIESLPASNICLDVFFLSLIFLCTFFFYYFYYYYYYYHY